MSKLMIALFVTAGLGIAGTAVAQMNAPRTTPISKATYTQTVQDADAQFKIAKDACASLSGNAKDICVAEAKGKNSVAKADAESAYKHTAKARENARVVRAQANYDVGIEKCDDLAGNPKDVCVKQAKAELVKGKADAKVDRVASDTNKEAAAKQAEARKDASADKREAELKVAIEKCDALAGPTKDACVSNAKAQFGQS
ncbi:MAG: hypothetical protein ACM338_03930 [Betaproteobacteria bacterium]